jgi:hypothetical protein
VVLNSATGGFTISGDGDINTHTDGAGGSFTNIGANAFDLLNASNITVNDLQMTTVGNSAFRGKGVSGLVADNVDIVTAGDASNEHVFNFRQGETSGAQLTGTVTISDSFISNFAHHGVFVENFSGALTLSVLRTEFENNITSDRCSALPSSNCGGMGILLRADGTSSMTVVVDTVVFDRVDVGSVDATPEGNSGASMNITIRNSTFTGQTYVASNFDNSEYAINLQNAQGNGTLTFDVDGNVFNNYSADGVSVVNLEGGDLTITNGRIRNNTINHAHVGQGIGIFGDGANTGGSGTTNLTLTVAVTNNTVPAGTPIQGASLRVSESGTASGSTVNINVTATGNTFSAIPTGSRRPFEVSITTIANACFNITGNTIAAGNGGRSSINLGYPIGVSGSIRLQGMSGSGDTNAAAYLNANNTNGIAATVGGNNSITSATCLTPP